MNFRIFAVTVVYGAEPRQVEACLRHLAGSVAGVVVIDNSPATDPGRWQGLAAIAPALHSQLNGANVGVARALNQGMEIAWHAGADFVLLLDDDSSPAPGMVDAMLQAWMAAAPDQIAAVGPDYTAAGLGGRTTFVRLQRWRFSRCRCEAADRDLRTDLLMTSGSLIHRDAARRVGGFREELFIDYVDTEWCLRALQQGRHCLVACQASMQHRFGDSVLMLPGLRRRIPVRAPVRSYYTCRNAVYLLRQPFCPPAWKAYEAVRLLALMVVHLLFAPPRGLRLGMSLRGVLDGLRGRGGPYAETGGP